MPTRWPAAHYRHTQLARGGPGKDYAAKLHDCDAITDGPPLAASADCSTDPLTCGVDILVVLQPCRQSTLLTAEAGHMRDPMSLRTSRGRSQVDGI
jgi:hypothetical protein